MNIIEKAADTYNVALNPNTPAGKELEELRRGTNFAGTLYNIFNQAIAKVRAGENVEEQTEPSSSDILAVVVANVDGASRETMGQIKETSITQGQTEPNQYLPQEQPQVSTDTEREI